MSESLKVTLPDGSEMQMPEGSRPMDVAQKISPRLADDAIVARVNGQLYDLTRPLEGDAKLEILTSKNPEALQVYRHSTAHLLAAAVLELFPETKLGIGPPIDTGFYYDFERETPFTPEDLEKIEARMWELQAKNLPYERVMTPKDDGLKKYADDWMKCELIEERAGDIFSEYTLGPHFIDFCRGPHVPATSRIKAFKLLSVAGAYWKGNEHNPRLQRIYGTAFFSKKELEAYLQQLEEAKKRDHRKLGQELDLFSIQELAGPGLIFFHPKGGRIRKILEDWMRDQYLARGYSLVYTPHVMRRDLWKTSGHANFYSENMFKPMELDDAEYQLKPMNCPGHILIYSDKLRSYRDLPVRLGELGTVYRYERSGVMHGLMRVRGFTQDDAHIFCTPEQIEDEVVNCLQFADRYAEHLRLRRLRSRAFHLGRRRERQVRRHAGPVAACRERAEAGHRAAQHESEGDPGRSRVLRAEDRRQAGGRHRPAVAAFHRAVRFHAAAALRPGIHRRGRQEAPAADGASRAVRLDRAVFRHPDRALCRRVSGVAGAGAGRWCCPSPTGRLEYARKVTEQLKSAGLRVAARRPQREGQPQDPRGAVAEDPLHAGGGRSRSAERKRVGAQPEARRPGSAARRGIPRGHPEADRHKSADRVSAGARNR